MWFFGLLSLAVAAGLAFGYRSKRRRLGLVESTEVCTVAHLRELAASMAEGLGTGSLRFFAAVSGKARCEEPLVSELAEIPAVYYSMRVQLETEDEAEDARGSRKQRSSEQLAHDRRSVAFSVEDATGSIAVDPEGAETIPEKALSRFEPASGGAALRVGSYELVQREPPAGGARDLGYRFEEEVIPVGADVYVLGEVTDPGGDLTIGSPAGEGKLVISTKSREQLVRELGSGSKVLRTAAIIFAVLGILLLLFG